MWECYGEGSVFDRIVQCWILSTCGDYQKDDISQDLYNLYTLEFNLSEMNSTYVQQ